MKGKIIKTGKGWEVEYSNKLLLHEDDINQIKQDSLMFDNIEGRILANPYVEFKIVNNKAKLI